MQFDALKAVAAIGYLVQETEADLYSVMKMIYLADKEHLGQFGRTITGDDFTAMPKGPIPEATYNLCKYVDGKRSYYDPLPEARELLGMEGHKFVLLAEPELSHLSKSDRRALDYAADIYRRGGWKAVANASHDSAWKAAWAEAEARSKGSIAIDINAIAASLENGPALVEFLSDPHPGEAESAPC